MRAWWDGRSLRTRIVLSAAVPLSVALVIATVAVAAVFSAGRLRDLDGQTRTASDTLRTLVATDQLPGTLPLPAGSPLLEQVLASDGSVLAASPGASQLQPLAEPSGPGVRTDEEGSYAGTPLRVRVEGGTLAGRRVTIVVAAPLGDIRRALRALKVVLLVVVPLLVAGSAWLVYLVAGLALRPVEQLRAAAEEMAADPAASAVLPGSSGADEIGRLSRTLNALLASQRALVAQQQAFVADAAHELRSPLAGLRVQLDIAQEHPSLAMPELIPDLQDQVGRLATLVEDLLALARLEGGRLELLPVDLREIAGGTGDPVLVLGDAASLGRLVDNLTANARRYATTVEVRTWSDGSTAVLDVDDDGPGIAPVDRERVFDRWVRVDPSRDRAEGGSGLGLALVREIARRHGGDVAVLDSPLGGARLRVRLPGVSG